MTLFLTFSQHQACLLSHKFFIFLRTKISHRFYYGRHNRVSIFTSVLNYVLLTVVSAKLSNTPHQTWQSYQHFHIPNPFSKQVSALLQVLVLTITLSLLTRWLLFSGTRLDFVVVLESIRQNRSLQFLSTRYMGPMHLHQYAHIVIFHRSRLTIISESAHAPILAAKMKSSPRHNLELSRRAKNTNFKTGPADEMKKSPAICYIYNGPSHDLKLPIHLDICE